MASSRLPRFTRGRFSRASRQDREPGAAKECSRPREPPGGDASWLVLVRAPRIPLTAAGALCASLTERAWVHGAPAPLASQILGRRRRGEKSAVCPDS